jgi:hypothetical protein
VVIKPTAPDRPRLEPVARPPVPAEGAAAIGPYRLTGEIVPGNWLAGIDPVLRRQVWLLRRASTEPSAARRDLARSGRLRWLQQVETAGATWDVFEALQGVPLSSLIESGTRLRWGTLRHWLHDLASELWAATGDDSLPAELSLDHVWITAPGQAVLLDAAWPDVKAPAERIPVVDIAGQQRFLNAVAACAESTSLPLHARPVLQNLADGKFEKLSFLTGTLRGLLDRPAEVNGGIRAAAIFLLPTYVWIMVFVGAFHGADWLYETIGNSVASYVMTTAMLVLAGTALIQFLGLPLRTTVGNSLFRLAVVDDRGERAGVPALLGRWAIAWLPLLAPMSLLALWIADAGAVAFSAFLALFLLWIGAAGQAVIHPNRGLHDRLSGTWVVRH